MTVYLALGDSISIDDYTGVHGGGAPSQLARKLGLELIDLTRDGNTTAGVLADLAAAPAAADVVTITAGGNDLLGGVWVKKFDSAPDEVGVGARAEPSQTPRGADLVAVSAPVWPRSLARPRWR